MKKEINLGKDKNKKENAFSLYLYKLDLPIINKKCKNNNYPKLPETNPNIEKRVEEYKKVRDIFKLPKLDPNSIRYHQILTTDNVKELAKKYLQSNKNIFSYLKDKSENFRNKIREKMETKERNNTYNNKINNMVRLHSSRYHPENEIKKNKLDEFDIMLNKLKYGKYYIENDEDREIKYRQRLAFKYRFLKNRKNIFQINFNNMNTKMNKLLNISKSLSDYLINKREKEKIDLKETKNEENKKTDSVNNSINLSSINSKSSRRKNLYNFKNIKRKTKSDENLNINNRNNLISFDKNGKKFIHHLSLIL